MESDMPLFYFHQYVNGRRNEDEHGKILANADEACSSALRRIPVI
jgi:hypothetical protein